MKIYKKSDVEKYLENDWILEEIKQNECDEEKMIRTHQWMLQMENKRMIYADVYGDILCGDVNQQRKVLDVGGGYNALTKLLAKNSQYTLVDFLAHGGKEYLEHNKNAIEWYCGSWYDYEINKDYDIIIANDIFPDVDQRMEFF